MSKAHIQFAGLLALSMLAAALLFLIGYTFDKALAHVTPEGKVPILDAGLITALLLAFQQTVTTMRSIWESQERSALAEGLSNSMPTASPNPPADPLPTSEGNTP